MSLFEYHATAPDGTEASGRIEAATSDDARRLLNDRGMMVRDLRQVDESPPRGTARPLTSAESNEFAGQLAQFGATGLPLEAGLRAAAAELANQRVAAALNQLADQLARGVSLEAAIAHPDCPLPAHVSGLVAAAARTGRLGTALAELLDHQYEVRALRRDTLRGFAYPLFVLGVAWTVVFVIMFGISGVFEQMFDDFQLELPHMTLLLFWWRDIGIWVLLAGLASAAFFAVVVRQTIGGTSWLRLIATMPIVGPISYWSGMAEWTGLLGVLVRHDIPLPEALRFSARGVRNAYVGRIADDLAEAAEQGNSFSEAMAVSREVPASLVPVIRWGERTGALAEALATSRELFSRRVRVRSLLLRTVLPPMLFLMIVCQVGAMVMALFMPLFNLIQGLS